MFSVNVGLRTRNSLQALLVMYFNAEHKNQRNMLQALVAAYVSVDINNQIASFLGVVLLRLHNHNIKFLSQRQGTCIYAYIYIYIYYYCGCPFQH